MCWRSARRSPISRTTSSRSGSRKRSASRRSPARASSAGPSWGGGSSGSRSARRRTCYGRRRIASPASGVTPPPPPPPPYRPKRRSGRNHRGEGRRSGKPLPRHCPQPREPEQPTAQPATPKPQTPLRSRIGAELGPTAGQQRRDDAAPRDDGERREDSPCMIEVRHVEHRANDADGRGGAGVRHSPKHTLEPRWAMPIEERKLLTPVGELRS